MRALESLSLVLVLAALPTGFAGAQSASLTFVPNGSTCRDVTPDGEIVVGSASGQAFTWRWKVDPVPTLIGGINAVAVSNDGSVIAGNVLDGVSGFNTPAIWTEATGWTQLSGFASGCPGPGTAYDISGDGTIITGLGWNGCSALPFRWTEATGALFMEELVNRNSRASVVSDDGSLHGGFTQGNFNRTPAVWFANLSGVVFDADVVGEIYGIQDDGSLVLGEWDGNAFTQGIPGPFTNLGNLNGGFWSGNAVDVSADGRVIVGFDTLQLARDAWVWTEAKGIQRLSDLLTTLGVPNVPSMGVCSKVSNDGQVVVGHTPFGGAWIATLPDAADFDAYGCGTNPAASIQVLSGAPAIGSAVRIGVDNPLGTQPVGSVPFLALAGAPAPGFPCGIPLAGFGMSAPGAAGELLISLVPPNPFLTLVGGAWTGAGNPVAFLVPLNSDASLIGLTFYAQGVMWDFTGASGIPFGLTDSLALTIGI